MKKLLALVLVAVLALSLAACRDGDSNGDFNIRPETPIDLYDGKWFQNGEFDGDYYLIEGNTYQKFVGGSSDEPVESGTYIIRDGESFRFDEHLTSGGLRLMVFTQDDGSSPYIDSVYVSDYNQTLYYIGFDSTLFFLRESTIGTEEGDGLIVKYLFLYDFPCEHNNMGARKVLQFIHSGNYRITEYIGGDETGEITLTGSFDMSEGGIALYYDGDRFMAYFTNEGTSIWIEEFDEEYFFN